MKDKNFDVVDKFNQIDLNPYNYKLYFKYFPIVIFIYYLISTELELRTVIKSIEKVEISKIEKIEKLIENN